MPIYFLHVEVKVLIDKQYKYSLRSKDNLIFLETVHQYHSIVITKHDFQNKLLLLTYYSYQ